MPPHATDRTLTLKGISFHYRDWGGTGTPLVLLHGLASTSHIWDLTAPLLAQGCRVLALDQRGHGTTAKPDNGYDFKTFVGDLHAFVHETGLERPLVAGHSWGGNVALEYGAAFPDEPRGLVLLDGGTFEVGAYMNWEETLERLSPPPLAGVPLVDFKARLRGFFGDDLLTPEVEAIILRNFEVDAEERIYPRLSRELHLRIVRALWEQRPSQLYERVQCPVLILPVRWEGRDDPERLAIKAREIALAEKLLRDVQVIWFDDSLHDVPLQRPQELADTIARFANRL